MYLQVNSEYQVHGNTSQSAHHLIVGMLNMIIELSIDAVIA